MSKNLEEFKKMIKFPNKMFNTNQLIILGNLIPILVDFEKRIDSNKDSINLLNENVRKLHNRIRKLEQKDSYYPMSEEEIKNIKVGGTD